MKRFLSFVLIIMSIGVAAAQSYSDVFDQAFALDDVPAQRNALELWQREAPNDVNLFIARYNFFANLAMGQQASLSKTGASQTVAAIHWADSALAALDEGIALYPDRLDLYFGKIYFLGEVARWDAFEREILKMLDSSRARDHRWTFPNVTDGIESLISEAVMDYQATMMATLPGVPNGLNPLAADSAMTRRVRNVARRTIQLFPSDANALYLLGMSYVDVDNEKALKYLLRADELEGDNAYVLGLLAAVCDRLGRKGQAANYRERMKN